MINFTLQRIFRLMPEYFPQKIAGYQIDISPAGKWRKFFRFFHIESPYFVGDEINLTFTFKKIDPNAEILNSRAFLTTYAPQIKFDNPSYGVQGIPQIDTAPVKVNHTIEVNKDGIVQTCFYAKDFPIYKGKMQTNEIELFSTGIIHRDFVRRDIFLILLGIFGGGFLGCIAGIVAPLILAHFTGGGK